MTFTQLRTFALVAELGSLRAAAVALGVSEPAVSAAVAALRADLGDPLFRRTGTGIALTPGGRALASRARELVRLADRTRREVAQATSADRLRVLATPGCAEHVADAVLAAFRRRLPRAAAEVTVGATGSGAAALADDVADIVLGVRPLPPPGQALDAVPFLRYERVVVAAPGHLPGRGGLAAHRWLAGPAGIEAGSEEARWLGRLPRPPRIERLGSETEALAAVRDGGGVMLALAHAVRADLRRGSVVRLPVAGTPVAGMWWATVPGDGAATAAARALQGFLTTPEATSALLRGGDTGRSRARPTVRVELWSERDQPADGSAG